jgi:hypothetical protein
MLCGIGQRTAVAITLIGVLLLSVGTCVLPAQRAAHSCCMHMSMPCESLQASCCVAAPQSPPAAVTPLFTGLTQADVAQNFHLAGDASNPREALIAAVLPSQSPPPGNFILRI